MIPRRLAGSVAAALRRQPGVVLLGPRQVGKTTLALEVASSGPSLYLDLESPADRAKLAEPELFLAAHADELVILDELQRIPELFATLRGVIDRGRRDGRRAGRFLLLGSASLELSHQSSESLAGRIAVIELGPFDATEVDSSRDLATLWMRGGFPESFLASSDEDSFAWRADFVRTYTERDIPALGPRIPAETIRRFWTMLAHEQGALHNAAKLAASLGVSGQTIARYVDLLVDLMLLRRLPPLISNAGKRLVRSPRLYLRDSGIVHALLGIENYDGLLGHPVAGASWEGFVIENILAVAPAGTIPSFYRTSAGAELDLVLDLPGRHRWAIEVKRSLTPKLERGGHAALVDVKPDRAFVVYPGPTRYPLTPDVEVVSLAELLGELRK